MCLRDLQIEIKTKVSRAKSKAWAAAEWSNLAQICRDPFAMAGLNMTALLRSDGRVSGVRTIYGQIEFPSLDEGVLYAQVSASFGLPFVALLRSDGRVLACGHTDSGQCNIPPLDEGGVLHPGFSRWWSHCASPKWWPCYSVVACGTNHYGQCNILRLDTGGFHQQWLRIFAALDTPHNCKLDGEHDV